MAAFSNQLLQTVLTQTFCGKQISQTMQMNATIRLYINTSTVKQTNKANILFKNNKVYFNITYRGQMPLI